MKNYFKSLIGVFNDTPLIADLKKAKAKPHFKNIIEEIHHSFDTEMENILNDAKITKSLETLAHTLQEKANGLKKLGFQNTSEVKELELLIEKNNKTARENKEKQKVFRDIQYLAQKYPQYKAITEESLQKLCEKYKLYYAAVNFFKGTVPQKNLNEMLNMKIQSEELAYISSINWGDHPETYASCRFTAHQDGRNTVKAPLIIAAPLKDFDTTYLRINENTYGKLQAVKLDDPIVLQPVYVRNSEDRYDNNMYYLIITAWGDEASDEAVVNNRMN